MVARSRKGGIAWGKDKYNLFRQQVNDSFVADCAMAVLKTLENCISKEKFSNAGEPIIGGSG